MSILDINCLPPLVNINPCPSEAIAMGDFKQVGILLPWSDVNHIEKTISEGYVNFDMRIPSGLKVYDRSFVPFYGTATTEEIGAKSMKYNDLVVFPFFNRSAENANEITRLMNTNEKYIFIVENEKFLADGSNQFIAKGVTAGLTLKGSMQDRENQAAYKIELQQMNSGYPELFFFDTDAATTNAKLNLWTNYDQIYGGTIATGGDVKLTIDSDKTGYVKLPNGTILTSVAGVIDTTYAGIGGDITYYAPKDSVVVFCGSSDLNGSIVYNGVQEFDCQANLLLDSVYAPKTINLFAQGCALTFSSIGDQLLAFVENNKLADGYADFSGGTSATQAQVNTYLISKGTTLVAVSAILSTWTLIIN